MTQGAWAGRQPFKFLDHFVEEESSRFFGRERETADLLSRISTTRALVLYGRSGIGKTSLVRAGLIPALRDHGFLPLYVRLLKEPVADLRGQIASAVCAPRWKESKRPPSVSALLKYAELKSRRAPVLIFDQLEELFARFPDPSHEKRREVIDAIRAVVFDPRIHVHVLFSLRQDYVAELDDLDTATGDMLDNRYRLRGLTPFGARQAMLQPLLAEDIDLSPKAAQSLLQILGKHAYQPVVLQIVCSEIYREAMQRHPERRAIDLADVPETDGEQGAPAPLDRGQAPSLFDRYLDTYLRRVDAATAEPLDLVLRAVMEGMLTAAGTKRAITEDTLAQEIGIRAARKEVTEVLSLLVRERLVRPELRGDERWYELVHDRLAEKVRPWLPSSRRYIELRFARQLVRNLAEGPLWRDTPNALLGDGQLEAVVRPFRDRLRLRPEERELLLRSAIHWGSSDVRFWADELGEAESSALVRLLLDSKDPTVREGAAAALASVPADDGLAGRCLEMALEDSVPAVRRAAGRSFWAVARAPAIEQLRKALRSKKKKARAALQVLADADREEPLLRGFSRWTRQRAAGIRNQRRIDAHGEDIRTRRRTGTVWGLCAVPIWWVTVGLPMASLVKAIQQEEDGTSPSWFLLAVPTLLVGALFGRWLASAAAHQEAVSGETRFWRAMLRLRALPWVVPLAVVFPTYFWQRMTPQETLENEPGWAAAPSPWLLLVALAASVALLLPLRWMRSLIQPQGSARRVVLWSLGASLGLPLLVPLLACAIAIRFGQWADPEVVESLLAAGYATALLFSLTAWIATLVLGQDRRSRKAEAAPDSAPDSARRAAAALVASALALPALIAVALPRSALPFTADEIVLQEGLVPPPLPPATWLPDSWIVLENKGHTPLAVTVSVPQGTTFSNIVSHHFQAHDLRERMLLLAPPGHARLSVSGRSADAPRTLGVPLAIAKLDGTPTLKVQRGTLAYVRLARSGSDPNVWEAVVTGTAGEEVQQVRIDFIAALDDDEHRRRRLSPATYAVDREDGPIELLGGKAQDVGVLDVTWCDERPGLHPGGSTPVSANRTWQQRFVLRPPEADSPAPPFVPAVAIFCLSPQAPDSPPRPR